MRKISGLVGLVAIPLSLIPTVAPPAVAQREPIAQVSPAAAPTVQEKIAFRRKTIRTMSDQLEQVKAAVQARRYGDAQTTFEQALKKWYTFGGTIKRVAPERYAKMSPGFANVRQGLYSAAVPLSTLKADLQALVTEAKAAVVVSDAQE